jgi:hypothetical protein
VCVFGRGGDRDLLRVLSNVLFVVVVVLRQDVLM